MNIAYFAPFARSWNRMIKMLFKPFQINKWFALGFTAFLAGLLDWPDKGNNSVKDNNFDLDRLFNLPDDIKQWIELNQDWFTLIVTGIVLLVLLLVLLTWLSSRGKFMFLDNVVHDRYQIKKPWRDFKTLGNSLFFWRIGYGLFCLLLFGSYVSYVFVHMREMYESYASDGDMIAAAIKYGLFFFILVIITGYISLFTDDFVVPLMYKSKSMIWIGWSRFLPLFTQHFFSFLLYGLFVFILFIIVAIFIVIGGILTCCIGIVILIIPYIGSVILLPVSVTFRAFSLEFLEQFGSQYKIFPDTENNPSAEEVK